jgi:hypothetical protein
MKPCTDCEISAHENIFAQMRKRIKDSVPGVMAGGRRGIGGRRKGLMLKLSSAGFGMTIECR